jgi:hypothetical protein
MLQGEQQDKLKTASVFCDATPSELSKVDGGIFLPLALVVVAFVAGYCAGERDASTAAK